MAEYKFNITGITTELKNRRILINCSLDVDGDTFSDNYILLSCRSSNQLALFETEIDQRTIILKLLSDIMPNEKYLLVIQKGIRAITGEPLDAAVVKSLVFESAVTSAVNILKPATFQEVSDNLLIEYEETGDRPVNSYLVQVAAENGFCNIVYSAQTREKSILFPACRITEPGQYFIRVRAQLSDDDYGSWSRPVTFIIPGTTNIPEEAPADIEDAGPEIEDLTGNKPENTAGEDGDRVSYVEKYNDETPSCFRIVFPFPVDITDMKTLLKRGDF